MGKWELIATVVLSLLGLGFMAGQDFEINGWVLVFWGLAALVFVYGLVAHRGEEPGEFTSIKDVSPPSMPPPESSTLATLHEMGAQIISLPARPPVPKRSGAPSVLHPQYLNPSAEDPQIVTEWAGGRTVTLLIVNKGATATFEASARLIDAEFEHTKFDLFRLRWDADPYLPQRVIEHGRDEKLLVAEVKTHYAEYRVWLYETFNKTAQFWSFNKARFFKFELLLELHSTPPMPKPWVQKVLIDLDRANGIFNVGFSLEN